MEQGEVSATFRKCIYKKHFLWYNENVGACNGQVPFFRLESGSGIGYRKSDSQGSQKQKEITLDRASQHNQGLFLFTLDI